MQRLAQPTCTARKGAGKSKGRDGRWVDRVRSSCCIWTAGSVRSHVWAMAVNKEGAFTALHSTQQVDPPPRVREAFSNHGVSRLGRRGLLVLLVVGLLLGGSQTGASRVSARALQETRFWTGCDPGPFQPPPPPEHVQTELPAPTLPRAARISVDLNSWSGHRPII